MTCQRTYTGNAAQTIAFSWMDSLAILFWELCTRDHPFADCRNPFEVKVRPFASRTIDAS